jgi:hypothetical protein
MPARVVARGTNQRTKIQRTKSLPRVHTHGESDGFVNTNRSNSSTTCATTPGGAAAPAPTATALAHLFTNTAQEETHTIARSEKGESNIEVDFKTDVRACNSAIARRMMMSLLLCGRATAAWLLLLCGHILLLCGMLLLF